ncbi:MULTISPECIES: hypothetical protein [Ramlibacter]|uniref:Uncharacterized protein n=1 Tax=Ramlibacter aquaticus TaxID=2780094 RepID=A0ABR9SCR5_9BURK|nr:MULTISPECIES: hypothetical protein [Ramlibacter]MBE7940151.1 hypothetical protein [Ramlibacter aquaticus]
MRPLSLPFVLFFACCAAAPATRAASFGITDLTSDLQQPCVTFHSSASSGERIKVVLLPSQKVVGARITERIQECGSDQEKGFAYKLEIDEALDQERALIAVRGRVPPTMTFKECATSESLHLTAWVKGRRVWHGYYYLGYDVAPDCQPEEVKQ